MTMMMTHHQFFQILQQLMEQWEMVTQHPLDWKTVTMMMIYRYDGGAAVVIETTGPNHLLSVCEALPPHLLHEHRGQMRYTPVITSNRYFV